MTKKYEDLFAGFDPDELMVMDGYDGCIAGVVERFGKEPIVCYDKEEVIAQLEADGVSRTEAEEYFYFNQIGAWMGDLTPCFLSKNAEAHPESGGAVCSLCCDVGELDGFGGAGRTVCHACKGGA